MANLYYVLRNHSHTSKIALPTKRAHRAYILV